MIKSDSSYASGARPMADALNFQYAGIFEKMPHPAILFDLSSQQILNTNSAFKVFLQTYGLVESDIIVPLDKLTVNGSLQSEEHSILNSSHQRVSYLLTTDVPLALSATQNVQIIYLTDISYIKKIENDYFNSGTWLNESTLTNHIGYWDADPITGLSYVCPKMAKEWGLDYSKNPIPAEEIMNAVHKDDQHLVWSAVEKALLTNTPYYCEYRVVRPDKTIIWVEGRGEYIKDINNHPVRFTGTTTNITNRVEEKTGLIKELEQVRSDIEQLKLAQVAAENANKNKSLFLANISHEIRTPLTAILGFAEILKSHTISENEKIQCIETINRNSNSLIKIIDDVLDLSKVEANCLKLDQKELSLEKLIVDITNEFKSKAYEKNLYLELDILNDLPMSIISDATRIQQILTNLLSNAIKFTEAGGITIQVKSVLQTSTMAEIQIRVIDTGVGLTQEQQNCLFKPFVQADNHSIRHYGGNGLGLALSKHLAEALNGDLQIEHSEKNLGSVFCFSFFAEIIYNNSLAENSKPTPSVQMQFLPLTGAHILLAEDSLDNQYYIEKLLTHHGAQVTVANNGKEAIEHAKTTKFDLVLMDIEMPEMNGYDATQSLRRSGFKKPILALTAHAMADEKNKILESGCNGCLTKPINTAQLLKTLESYLNIPGRKKSTTRNQNNNYV